MSKKLFFRMVLILLYVQNCVCINAKKQEVVTKINKISIDFSNFPTCSFTQMLDAIENKFLPYKETRFRIRSLNLRNNNHKYLDNFIFYIISTIPYLSTEIDAFDSLESLNLGDCPNLSDHSLNLLKQSCSKLKTIVLRNCNQLTAAGAEYFLGDLTNLEMLNIEGCFWVTDPLLLNLAEKNKNLKELSIYNCENVTFQNISLLKNKFPNLVINHNIFLETSVR